MMALAILLGLSGVQVFLAALGWVPVHRHGAFLELFLVVPGEGAASGRNQGSVDDLATAGDVVLL